jgi:hypothetical protein
LAHYSALSRPFQEILIFLPKGANAFQLSRVELQSLIRYFWLSSMVFYIGFLQFKT